MKKDELIKKWLNGDLSDQEMKDFSETGDFKEIDRIDQYLAHFKAPEYNVSEAKSKVLKNRKDNQVHHKLSFLSFPTIIKIAASIIIVAGIAFYFLQSGNTVKTISSSQVSAYYLPDSSFLKLNTQSTISFSDKNWEDERSLNLVGEAYFKVNRGSKFSVQTANGVVSVLGTEFNVKARDNYLEVICFEGSVQIANSAINKMLKKGDMIQIVDGNISESIIEEKIPSWLVGKSTFKSIPLKLVLKELERQYEIKIKAENISDDRLFTGTFVNDNIDLALRSITIPMNLSFEIKEGLVILSSDSNH